MIFFQEHKKRKIIGKMLQVSLILLVLFGLVSQVEAQVPTITINAPTSGATLNPLNAAANTYLQSRMNGYGSPYGYADVSPYAGAYSPYGNAYSPYGNAYSPYGNPYAQYGNAINPYQNGVPAYGNGFAPYGGVGASHGNAYIDYLNKYGYDNKYYSPIVLGHEFGAGTQVGIPGMPGSYRIRMNGALVAESTAPGTPGAYASPLSLSGYNLKGYDALNPVGKKKK